MATTTFHDYDGNGSTTTFAFTFPTFKEAEVVVEVDNVIKTTSSHYNITSYSTANGGNVVFTSGNIPAAGTKNIRIYRDTDVDNAKATYTAGSSVKAGDLNNNQLQALRSLQEEQNQTVNTAKIKDGAVTNSKLAADSVAGANIQDDVINSQHYIAGSIDLEHMSANSVDSDQYVDGSIDLAHMSANSVDSDQYVDGSIDNVHLADDSITNAKINSSAAIAQSKIALDADLTNLSGCQTGASAALAALTQAEVQTLDGVTSTTAELNYVDGVTSNVQTQLNAKQASDAELTELATMHTDTASALADLTQAEVQILDGATVTTDELNKLDGVTASATDLNIVASMTKQTTITDQDTSYPTSGAVVDYVAAQIAPIGGLEVIADDESFPNTQPAAGVVISITDAAGLSINSSGVSTNGDTLDNTTVTINGFPSALRGGVGGNADPYVLGAGSGLMVQSTGSSQTYNYHKALIKESDYVQLSDDINDFNSRYRIASSAPGSDNDEGDLYFDTAANKMYVYDGSAWGEVTSTGDFKYLVLCVFNSGTGNAGVINGSISKYDLRENTTSGSLASITSAAQLMVSINGVVQKPNSGTSIGSNDGFCMVDNHTIEFGANLPSGSEVFIIQSGSALGIAEPGNNTVTAEKLDLSIIQGDIIYGTGTDAWAKLAKGTAGQVLKMNSGATAPEWGTDTGLTQEQVEDYVGGMVTGNTETGITVTYEDSDGTLDFVVADQTPEGTAILSTGETGTTKFLRVDGDNSCSWQVPPDTVYTHPNHSGEVTSTADGAQVIASNVVDEDNLKIDNTPTNDHVLTAKSSAAGGLTWAAATTDFSSLTDTTVSTSDPAGNSNPSATGHVWVNKNSGECYVCTDATSNSNVWTNIGDGTGAKGNYSVDFMIAAGGGGGGSAYAGGGGGGGMRASYNNETSGGGGSSETAASLARGTQYTITVGNGGAGGTWGSNGGDGDHGDDGGASSISGSGFTTLTSNGGGGGGGRNYGTPDNGNGRNGGCGGGGSDGNGGSHGSGGDGTAGQGYDGADGNTNYDGGGGGGAGQVGDTPGGNGDAGNGGNGQASSISGSSVTRCGGGGGAQRAMSSYVQPANGNGGSGGGGNGARSDGTNPVAGNGNEGGGGGGGGDFSNQNGAAGGSGQVYLRMATANYSGTTTGSPTVTTSGSDTILRYNGSGTYTA